MSRLLLHAACLGGRGGPLLVEFAEAERLNFGAHVVCQGNAAVLLDDEVLNDFDVHRLPLAAGALARAAA